MSVTTEQPAPHGDAATVDDPTADDAAANDDAANIDVLRREIDRLDAEILQLVKERTDVSRRIGAVRMAGGGPRIVYSREIHVLSRFRELGEEGRELAMLLLRLGRGRLGGR